MFYQQATETRELFFQSWKKFKQKTPLTALEQQITAVILEHPEYHKIFEDSDFNIEKQYFAELGETNPFLHLGLHLAVREQIATNRPLGIKTLYDTLSVQLKSPQLAEHQMMNCLVECLWQAQQNQTAPDELNFLQLCQQLIEKSS